MRKFLIFLSTMGLAACIGQTNGDGDSEGDAVGSTTSTGAEMTGPSSGVGVGGSGAGGEGGSQNVGGGATSGGGDPCPQDMVCVTSFPFRDDATTTGAASDAFDVYACGGQNEAGPEVIYRIDVPSDGFLYARLPDGSMPDGVDIDLHLLASLDPNDCLDRGHWELGELLPAGRYYLVADSWVADNGDVADGDYRLELGLVTTDDLTGWGMTAELARDALGVLDRAWTMGDVDSTAFGVVDFALHASEKRFWAFDFFEASLRHHVYTTVGEASDPDGDGWANAFSNVSGSHQSSLGLMKGAELYTGSFGQSMRLDGLEVGYNHAVRSRVIVMHPWNGSTDAYVNANPSTGAAPTWGCLGIDPAIANDLRTFLGNGGLVLSHFPDGDWSNQSSYLP